MTKPRIALDLDGVVYPFAERFHEWAQGLYGVPGKYTPPTQWDFYKDWGWSGAEWREAFGDFCAAGEFAHGEPLPFLATFLEYVEANDVEFMVVTSRPVTPEVRKATWAWCGEHLPGTTILITNDKVKGMRDNALNVLIDDKPENVQAAIDAGFGGMLMVQPWNRESDVDAFAVRQNNTLGVINLSVSWALDRVEANPTTAARHNAGKPEMSQLCWFDWQPLADHCAAGREKYPDVEVDGRTVPNWTLGGKPDSEYIDAAMRHLLALGRGEEFDPETATHHAAAVQWNMGALLTNNRSAS